MELSGYIFDKEVRRRLLPYLTHPRDTIREQENKRRPDDTLLEPPICIMVVMNLENLKNLECAWNLEKGLKGKPGIHLSPKNFIFFNPGESFLDVNQ